MATQNGRNHTRIGYNRAGVSILLVFVGASSVMADTYYVNGGCGNDSWTGTSATCASPNGPKQTIQAGINVASDGDTILVADFEYAGANNNTLDFGGRK